MLPFVLGRHCLSRSYVSQSIGHQNRSVSDAPRSITAISSSIFALNEMPADQIGPGRHAVRVPVPIRIARTKASRYG